MKKRIKQALSLIILRSTMEFTSNTLENS